MQVKEKARTMFGPLGPVSAVHISTIREVVSQVWFSLGGLGRGLNGFFRRPGFWTTPSGSGSQILLV